MCRAFKFIFPLMFMAVCVEGLSQPCTTLGQTPTSAFPVCATTSFTQLVVPLCTGGNVPAKGCPQTTYGTSNPFFYKFTCFTDGKLGFVITPLNTLQGEDYDWQLFDITNRNPQDIYTDASLIVCANWAGTYGPTGASAAGTSAWGCSSDPLENKPTFSTMPDLLKGHEYLLVVSHFFLNSPNETGYTLAFQSSTDGSGGLAVITDPAVPVVESAYGVCDGTEVVVKLNMKMNCSSLAADGSDFTIAGPGAPKVIGSTGNGCTSSFDMDYIRLKLDKPLVLGQYTITAQVGSDGNSLMNNCQKQLTTGMQVKMNYIPKVPTPMDSITPPICITDSLRLVFRKPMLCKTIAADGSDFTISGPVAVTVKTAKGVCTDGLSSYIDIILTKPIKVNGTFTITLKNGTDGNTLLDECEEATPAGSTLNFTTKNIANADFIATIAPGCKFDTAYFTHDGYGNTNQWQWTIDNAAYSTQQNTTLISKAFGTHHAKLAVTNGICSDVVSQTFVLPDRTVKAGYEVSDTLCPTDALTFTDMSGANASAWKWTFGNGTTGNTKVVTPQFYPLTGKLKDYVTSLEVGNALGCTDITFKIVTVLASCYIAVPSAFTPNGDGLNDYLHPLNAFKAADMEFRVFNRYGQILFESHSWTKKWDGTYKGIQQPAGTYVWYFSYTNTGTGEKVVQKGTSVLIR